MTDATNDFARLFEAKTQGMSTTIPTGTKVTGRVIQITAKTTFVDLGVQCDGYLDTQDLTNAKGELTVKIGDEIQAVNVGWTDEGYHLAVRAAKDMTDAAVEQAFTAKLPIEGKVLEERKGGYGVQVSGVTGFCPFSQMDLRGVRKEPAEYIGQSYMFLIQEYGEEGRNLVLNRRKLLEAEAEKAKEALKEGLNVGDIRQGTVVKVMPFGAFVDLGGGIEGMVHVSEMGWNRGLKAEEQVKAGDEVTVKIIDLVWGDETHRDRIALSMKQAEGDPWDRLADNPSYAVGAKRHGIVTRLADFGAFILLEPGIEGLAHISQLGVEERVNHPSDVLKDGQEVDVTVLGVDRDRRRVSLCIGEPKVKDEKPAALTAEQELSAQTAVLPQGEVLEGEVELVKPFGVFVKLPNGQTGMVHISRTPYAARSVSTRVFFNAYPLHSKIQVVVLEAQGNRISLTLPETLEAEAEANRTEALNVKDAGGSDFGSIGDLFSGLQF